MKTKLTKLPSAVLATLAMPALTESNRTMSKMKLTLVSASALALLAIAALLILPARATNQAGVSSVTIAHGSFDEIDVFAKTDLNPGNPTDYWKAMISTKGASHLYVLQNTVLPGGTFGWHSHTGPSLIIVMSGTATEYEGNDPTCAPRVHPAGKHSLMLANRPGTWCETMAVSPSW